MRRHTTTAEHANIIGKHSVQFVYDLGTVMCVVEYIVVIKHLPRDHNGHRTDPLVRS